MSAIVERYREKFRRSGELFERAKSEIPGAGHLARYRPFPAYIERGDGALKWDADGNELVDYVMGNGAMLLGNAHPKITESVGRRLSLGTQMASPHSLEVRWAELIKSLIPTAELVRFTGSGTESTYLAIRLARAYTGRSKVAKFRHHYHGWHDYVTSESGLNTDVGIPSETLSAVVVVEPSLAALEELLDRDHDVAAVILEPTGGHWGQLPLPNPEFLRELRELTARHGVVMIMDEVITGFRASRGGAQERFDVRPDLTTMGKIVAGGLPGGAVAGRAEIMDLLASEDPSKRPTQSGTFSGNPLSATAGITCLELIANEPINEHADAMAKRLKAGMRDALTKMEVPGHVHGVASTFHIVLGAECDCGGDICSLSHSEIVRAMPPEKVELLKLAMLNEGVDLMGGSGGFTSGVHTDADIDLTVEAFDTTIANMQADELL